VEDYRAHTSLLQFGPDFRQGLLFPEHDLAGVLGAQGVKGCPMCGGDGLIGLPVDAVQIPVVSAREIAIDRMGGKERLVGEHLGKVLELPIEHLQIASELLPALM
jgi:hypothetical protein